MKKTNTERTDVGWVISVRVSTYPRLPDKPFDYTWETDLPARQLVIIPFGPKAVLGIVVSSEPQTNATTQDKSSASPLKSIIRVIDLPVLPPTTIELADWLMHYYAATPQAVWKNLLASGLQVKRLGSTKTELTQMPPTTTPQLPELSQEQAVAIASIKQAAPQQPILLYGVTGSGKTRVYEELIKDCLESGQSALLLAPEIVLSTHLGTRLKRTWGELLHITHSGLTASRRRAIWVETLRSEVPSLYMGPRSALFLPIQNLGLIILDEEHDSSYKQDQSPRYHAMFVAGYLAKIHVARLVLGSATPSLTTLALTARGSIALVRMHKRFGNAELPSVALVEHHHKDGIISPELRAALHDTLQLGQQTLLLHNQRGSARRLSCDTCGETLRCSYCDTTLVLHADLGRLCCHVCDRNVWPPSTCPTCQSDQLHYSGIGTKQLEHSLRQEYPTARIERLDRDSQDRTTLPDLLARMEAGEIDILLGTQMIAKGLDFSQATLVGVIDADSLLHDGDFMAAERAASLMLQAAGRSGRGEVPGKVIIQTRKPSQALLQAVAEHNWDNFAKAEDEARKKWQYPPHRWLLRLWVRRASPEKAEADAEALVGSLQLKYASKIIILGPAAPIRQREGRWHIRQLIVKAITRPLLLNICLELPSGWVSDIDPVRII